MKLLQACFVFFLCANICLARTQPSDLDRLEEIRLRNGLPNFFEKIRKGGELKIAYLGGSITEAAGGWRDQSLQKLQEKFPSAGFIGINAAVSGTGSDLGVFRLQRDVLDHQPDLVFVEFAVNDAGLPAQKIHEAMEGIVRKIWRNNKHIDICFVYTVMEQMRDTLATGRLWSSMLAMEHIAEYYGIPTVMFAKPIMDLYQSGKMIFTGKEENIDGKIVFSPDRVHPYAGTGQKKYAECLMRFIDAADDRAAMVSHRLLKPYNKANWENAIMLPVSVLRRSGSWNELSGTTDSIALKFHNRLPALIQSSHAGASLTIRFKGSSVGLYDVIGPGCGQYKITIDDKDTSFVPRFDKYATFWRTHYFLVSQLPGGTHDVVFSVAAEKLDKDAIVKQPTAGIAKYAGNACYAGYVLLLGKLVAPGQ